MNIIDEFAFDGKLADGRPRNFPGFLARAGKKMDQAFWLDHVYVVLLGLVFLMAVTWSQPQLVGKTFSTDEKRSIYLSQSLFLYFIAILAMLVWWLGGRSFADLGFRWPESSNWPTWTWLTAIFVIWFCVDTVSTRLIPFRREKAKQQWRKTSTFMPSRKEEIPAGVHMSFAAGFGEEVVFRGYLIAYFALLTGATIQPGAELFSIPVLAAVLIPAVGFALSHLYLGWGLVLKIVWLAVMFGLIFVSSGSLLIVVILHFLIDVFACFVGPHMLADANLDSPDEPGLQTGDESQRATAH